MLILSFIIAQQIARVDYMNCNGKHPHQVHGKHMTQMYLQFTENAMLAEPQTSKKQESQP